MRTVRARKSIRSRPTIRISDLREEGVFEVGAVIGTSVIFVITEERALLCHSTDIPLRRLDGYCAGVAVARLESGERFRDVASGLGVSESDLRRRIADALAALHLEPRQFGEEARRRKEASTKREQAVELRRAADRLDDEARKALEHGKVKP